MTPWKIAVFCDAVTHDPAARPRAITAHHDGTRNSEWDLRGAELHVIGPDGERIDRRHWDAATRELASRSHGRRLRTVVRCRDCGSATPIAEARAVFAELDELRVRGKRSVKLSDLVKQAHEQRAFWADDA
jgi:hypothetical protein